MELPGTRGRAVFDALQYSLRLFFNCLDITISIHGWLRFHQYIR